MLGTLSSGAGFSAVFVTSTVGGDDVIERFSIAAEHNEFVQQIVGDVSFEVYGDGRERLLSQGDDLFFLGESDGDLADVLPVAIVRNLDEMRGLDQYEVTDGGIRFSGDALSSRLPGFRQAIATTTSATTAEVELTYESGGEALLALTLEPNLMVDRPSGAPQPVENGEICFELDEGGQKHEC